MAKEIAIGIRITTSGSEKVIKNLGDLEAELARLQQLVRGLDFGTKAYQEALRNIQLLKSRIDDFDKATEGLGAEKNFNALSSSISVLTGSFQVASGALGLFIQDSQTLEQVQKAEAAALNVLNLALGINAINKELVESRTKRLAIVENIKTKATLLATKAQELFNKALLANPYAVVIAGVVALTGAIFGLVKIFQVYQESQDKNLQTAKAAKKAEDELFETRKKASQATELQLKILTDNVETRALEKRTIEELKKTYPGFNAFVDENNKLNEKGVKFLETKIKLQQAEAVLQGVREKRAQAEIDLANKNNKLQNEGASITNQVIGFLFNRNAVLDEYVDNAKEYGDATRGLNDLETKYTKIVEDALGELEGFNKELDTQAEKEKKAAAAASKTITIIDSYSQSLTARNKAIEQYLGLLDDVSGAQLEADAEILDKQKEIIDEQKEFISKLGDATKPEREKFLAEQRELLFSIIPTDAQEKEIQDSFFDLFSKLRQSVGMGFGNTAKDFEGILDEYADDIAFLETSLLRAERPELLDPKLFQEQVNITKELIKQPFKDIDEETRKLLIDYFGGIADRSKALSKLLTAAFGDGINEVKVGSSELLEIEKTIAETRASQVESGRTDFAQKQLELRLIKTAFGFYEEEQKIRAKITEEVFKLQQAEKTGNQEQINQSKARLDGLQALLGNLDKSAEAIRANVVEGANFAIEVEKVNKEFEKQGKIIDENKQKIDKFLDPQALTDYFAGLGEGYDFILEDLNTNLDKYLERFGEDGVSAILRGISIGVGEVEFQTREDVDRYVKLLEQVGTSISNALKLGGNPFQPLIDGLKQVGRALPKELSGVQKFLSDAIVDGLSRKDIADKVLEAYSDISGRLTNIIASNNSLLLEQLSVQEQSALAQIGEANTESQKQNERILAERAIVEQQYAKKRFDIEKKARITELRFSVGQALADAAQATLNALANIPAPFGAIYAGVVGGLTAFQIKQIQAQLSFAQSQQYVARRGGAVSGVSHESGGVPMLLEGGEFIMNREAVSRFSTEIQAMNTSTGGKPLSIDDSRLVQAIASQNVDKKAPIKTFVLYQDIKDTEKLNNRISQLSRL